MSFWPDIDEKLAKKEEPSSNVKIPLDQLKLLYDKKLELEQIVSNTQLQIQNLTEENSNLKKNLQIDTDGQNPQEKKKSKSGRKLNQEIKDLKQKVSQKDLQVIKLMGEKNEKLKEISRLKEKIGELEHIKPVESNNEALESLNQIPELEEEIERLKLQITDKINENELLRKQLEKKKSKGKKSKDSVSIEEYQQLEDDLEGIQHQLADSFQENEQVESLLQAAKQTIEQLEVQLKDMSKENQHLIKEIETNGHLYVELKKENEELDRSFKIMSNNFKSMSKKYQKLKAKVQVTVSSVQNAEERGIASPKIDLAEIFAPNLMEEESPEDNQQIAQFAQILHEKTQLIKHNPTTEVQNKNPVLEPKIIRPSTARNTEPKIIVPKVAKSSISPALGQRIVCPNCRATGKKIKIREDKSQVISYIPQVLYKKVFVCSQCGQKF